MNCLLYADDLVLLSQSESGLQACLHKLERYVKKWKLGVNLKKSKVLNFTTTAKRRLYITSKWYFNGDLLECVEEYTYLGIIFHYGGSFKPVLKLLYNKALYTRLSQHL